VATNRINAEVPMTIKNVDLKLNDAGTLNGTLPVRGIPGDPYRYTHPGRSCVYVLRDGEPWWGGIIWTRSYASGDLTVGCSDWWTYYDHRYIVGTSTEFPNIPAPGTADTSGLTAAKGKVVYGDTATGAGVGQVAIIKDLIARASAVPGGDLGVKIIEPGSPDTIKRILSWTNFNLSDTVGEALRRLSGSASGGSGEQIIDGPDLMFGVHGWTPDGTAPQRALWIGGPQLIHTAEGVVFEYRANLLDYTWPSDAGSGKFATRAWAQGSGKGPTTLMTWADNTERLSNGWPLLETKLQKEESLATFGMLSAAARGGLELVHTPEVIPSLTVRTDRPPYLNYAPGDMATLVIRDDYFRDRLTAQVRIIGISASFDTPTATITVNPVTADIA
jgi:hypothetical protein